MKHNIKRILNLLLVTLMIMTLPGFSKTIEASTTKYNIVFSYGDRSKTIEKVELPYTFQSKWDGTGELDKIVKDIFFAGDGWVEEIGEVDTADIVSGNNYGIGNFITIKQPFTTEINVYFEYPCDVAETVYKGNITISLTPVVVHTVTFDPNNGTDEPLTLEVADGQKIKTEDIPSTDGYTNEGWTIYHKEYNNGWHNSNFKLGDGTFDFANTPITADTNLKLIWQSQFTVSAKDNLGRVGYALKQDDLAPQGSSGSFSFRKDFDDRYFFKAYPYENYRFVKWVNDKNQDVSISNPYAYDLTPGGSLTAVFEEDTPITITLYPSGGTPGKDWPAGSEIVYATYTTINIGELWTIFNSNDYIKAPEYSKLESITIANKNNTSSTTFANGDNGTFALREDSDLIFNWTDKVLCIKGNNNTWTKGSNKELSFTFEHTLEPKLNKYSLKGLWTNGNPVEEKTGETVNFTTDTGSLIINLQPAYLETLAADDYEMTATVEVFENTYKEVTVKFTIAEKSSGGTSDSSTPVYRLPKTGIE